MQISGAVQFSGVHGQGSAVAARIAPAVVPLAIALCAAMQSSLCVSVPFLISIRETGVRFL
jgi:hypothetical protein